MCQGLLFYCLPVASDVCIIDSLVLNPSDLRDVQRKIRISVGGLQQLLNDMLHRRVRAWFAEQPMKLMIGFEEAWPVAFANSCCSFDPCHVRRFELFGPQPRDRALCSAN